MGVTVYAGAALAGVVSHLGYFIRGEHYHEGPKLVPLYTLVFGAVGLGLYKLQALSILESTIMTAGIATSYFLALFTSILVYRAFFHRLGKFKGPFLGRLSNLYHVSKVTSLNNYKVVNNWHEEYGDIVRTGPSNLSVLSLEAIPIVYGSDSKCIKAPCYDMSLPTVSMHQNRDKPAHDKRRRIWSRGFSPNSLRVYEGRVIKYAEDLVRQLSSRSGTPLNASKWLNFFAFDVMGDLAFGSSFDMLKSGERHWVLELLEDGMKYLGMFAPIPWIFPVLISIPGAAKDFRTFMNWCGDQIETRRKMKGKIDAPDLMSVLIDHYEKNPAEDPQKLWLNGDSRLIIVAGSDTTASTLTFLFYNLAKDPTQIQKLRNELTPLFESGNTADKDLMNAEHLNGAINETLRLHPPVPSGLPRLTPPEGITIGDTFIPGDTTLMLPYWSMGRSEKIYPRAKEFIPERWYSSPNLVPHKEAWAPFSLGPFSCIGKALALMELRAVTARLVMDFDVSFAPGEDETALLEKTTDYFILGLAPLRLVFEKRAR